MSPKLGLYKGRFDYGHRTIFEDLNFEIDKGDILCLLGANGCGKTTLLRCLRGFLPLRSGSCRIDGTEISIMRTSSLAQKIGFVFQDNGAPFPYPVIEVVKMGRAPHLKMFSSPGAHDTAIAEQALETVGIPHLRDREFTHISGGERQLVAIARTIAQGPDVILMDEPTSALDFRNQTLVLQVIDKLARAGLTIILTTHYPNHPLLHACKVAMMNNGNFIAFGSAESVITESNLRRTYGIDVQILTSQCHEGEAPVRFCVPRQDGET
ncbi:ABC transporter ATP-binding protein [Sediminispirochaeta smaragdinae]|uniref:ABC transporter related protein n=1 Tax=Sediminispirochaeta smaragdinae (strain DSM 11293 / JCM 15392 / SEBR 4228) TaxID=573413 RepID=E1R866_SEDSS|nr:ABC transporter ATP-binding protein [Sediminispirochaeta smaragdinae]ADK82921.1 ABC transporter related protein [Sediminispirochaeta smaragdinae DSM 11293]